MQRDDAWAREVPRARYLERCELKTARLFEAACRLGATLGAPGVGAADPLAGFGDRIGIAFQIFDDVLDVSGPAERTGKPRGTDLLDGTVTLPLILARERDPSLAALDLRARSPAPRRPKRSATGSRRPARSRRRATEALRHVADAKSGLDALDLPAGQRRLLELVADGVVERYA